MSKMVDSVTLILHRRCRRPEAALGGGDGGDEEKEDRNGVVGREANIKEKHLCKHGEVEVAVLLLVERTILFYFFKIN